MRFFGGNIQQRENCRFRIARLAIPQPEVMSHQPAQSSAVRRKFRMTSRSLVEQYEGKRE
jgi:hypothetical protein